MTESQLAANEPPVRHNPTFLVTVPVGAELFVNGSPAPAPAGRWQSAEVSPGTYTFLARVAAPASCASARASTTVFVDDTTTGVQQLALAPRGCGWLRFNTQPSAVTYTASPKSGGRDVTGSVLSGDVASLPSGEYELTIESRGCAPFTKPLVQVRAGEEVTVRAPLICGAGKE